MTVVWARHALLPEGMIPKVRIAIERGRITEVIARVEPEDDDVRLPLVLPGLANAHSHAFHRAMRGRVQDTTGNFWTWRDHMYALAERLTPESYFALAHAVFVEMVSAGYTAVGEFHYLHHGPGGTPYNNPNAMGEAVIAAAHGAGIRLTLLDTLYLTGGLGGSGHTPLDPVQQRFGDPDVPSFAKRVSGLRDTETVRIGLGAHSVRAVPRDALMQLASIAGPRVVHAHVSEQPAENAATQLVYGLSPTALLAECGLVGRHFTAVHATHLTDADIDLLGDSGSFACICPTTERDLADGIGPAHALLASGTRLCLGTDQHVGIDPFVEVRGLEMHERLHSGERGRFTVEQLHDAMSRSGYASIGWPDGGVIEPGRLADLVAVRRDSARTIGSRAGQIIFSAGSADVTDVMVGGEFVVRDGQHRAGDAAVLLGKSLARVRDT